MEEEGYLHESLGLDKESLPCLLNRLYEARNKMTNGNFAEYVLTETTDQEKTIVMILLIENGGRLR